jgi:hypothetical protein
VVSAASQKPIIEPLSFKAVQPGVTTVDQVVENWGQPLKRQQQDGSQRLSYEFAPFRHISVTARDSVVVSVVVDLQQSFEAESLAQELGLDSFDPLEVRDRSGQALGQAFPEASCSSMSKASWAIAWDRSCSNGSIRARSYSGPKVATGGCTARE